MPSRPCARSPGSNAPPTHCASIDDWEERKEKKSDRWRRRNGFSNRFYAANAPRFLYASGAHDPLLGNDQFGRRYYDPTDGRWWSQDPLRFGAGDTNLYRYVFNNPVTDMDLIIGLDVAVLKTDPYGPKIKQTQQQQKKNKNTS